MLAEDVAALYKTLVDESNAAWSKANITRFLQQGYNAFRRRVMRQDPWIYSGYVDITPAGYTYDLAGGTPSVLGSAPSATKMEKILELRFISSDGRDGAAIPLVATAAHSMRNGKASAYLRGSSLMFNWSTTEQLRLWYVKASTVNWANISSGDNEYVDDLDQYHELIAFYAAEYYGVRDGALPRVQSLRREAERDLARYLMSNSGDSLVIASEHG